MNSVALVGNLTKDPENKKLPSGTSCCQFTVAVQRKYKNAQGQREADFIPCVAWKQTADLIYRYFTKGMRIGLTGAIQTRTYEAQDGQKKFVTEVIVDSVEFVTPRQQEGAPAQPEAIPPQPAVPEGFKEIQDDYRLPF